MKKEVATWRKVTGHPNIVKFIDASLQTVGNDRYLYILSEFCSDGHLLDLLEKNKGKLSERSIILVMIQVVNGILHLHDQNPPIAHRDIKVENILMKDKKVKL